MCVGVYVCKCVYLRLTICISVPFSGGDVVVGAPHYNRYDLPRNYDNGAVYYYTASVITEVCGQFLISYLGAARWNTLPPACRMSSSPAEFRSSIKSYLGFPVKRR